MHHIRLLVIISVFVLNLTENSLSAEPQILVSDDKETQVTLPNNWVNLPGLHESADLQAGNEGANQYIVVLTESKEDFVEMDLKTFCNGRSEKIASNIIKPIVTNTPPKVINGSPTMGAKIEGGINNVNVIYILACVEGKRNFHQVLAWTVRSKFEAAKPILESIINSFRELPSSS